ncbi:6091_t:CDS:2 [Dentiscutata erythropus]|uniref:6091_t:CDS:1 n=1 Tax=Dentiscutata erythropus TaxID=1348616 RepID=A0A9N8VEV7_9GLOM|nr:6091_t:CDS:2 [Dentiscutata erythropus]
MSEQKISLNNIDLNHSYTIKEFELINDKLKMHTLEINENPNLFSQQNSDTKKHRVYIILFTIWVDFNVGGQRTIRAPDISFTPKSISYKLTHSQCWIFQGQPFTPTLVVEAPTPKTFENKKALKINCPECSESFTGHYFFLKHYENYHALKQ